MKRVHNILFAIMSFAAVSCVEDINTDRPSAESGDEVQFGLSLDALTRTIYGEEVNNAFPIYWVNGDKVLVASPQCLDGRNSAEYEVSVSGAAQNYADDMTKTGDAGVQWGQSETATFYSIYPSKNASLSIEDEKVSATMNIAATQDVNYTLVDNTYYAAAMENVVMYAKTGTTQKGAVVNLNYKPLSTIIEFELNVGTEATGSVFIESLTLEAPTSTSIAGSFSTDFTLGTASHNNSTKEYLVVTPAATGGSNTITMQFQTQPELDKENPKLRAKMCLMPIAGVESLDGWKVSVVARNGADNTKATRQKTIETATNTSTALIPGMVHKVILPTLPTGDAWEYTPDNWIPQLPNYRNIYLTELSIPGAWYAGAPVSDGYQATSSISDLWDKGIRAFAVETRSAVEGGLTDQTDINTRTPPALIVVSGTGENNTVSTSNVGVNSLNKSADNDQAGYAYREHDNPTTLLSIFNSIIACLIEQENNTEKQSEFAVLVLSYSDGAKSGNRYVDYGAWLQLIYDAYNNLSDEYKGYVYQKEINSATTVQDVLNKLIIKINIDAKIAKSGSVKWVKSEYVFPWWKDVEYSKSYSYENNLPALFSYNPFLSQLNSTYYSTPLFSPIYWKNWEDSDTYRTYSNSPSNAFTWCFSSCNRTAKNTNTSGGIPTYAQRESALKAMMDQSETITKNSTHNVWFYFNVGGVEASDQTSATDTGAAKTFASIMNPWLLNIINNKTNGYKDDNNVLHPSEPSPLGIVMFNQCTGNGTTNDAGEVVDDYYGDDIIKAIIEMNNKFKLQYAVQ